nr:recombinase family protein [Methylobacterium currus]
MCIGSARDRSRSTRAGRDPPRHRQGGRAGQRAPGPALVPGARARSADTCQRRPGRLAPPRYSTLREFIANPAYGGAYAYGRSRVTASYDAAGAKARARRTPRSEWLALKPGSHEGYVEWERRRRSGRW